MVKVEQVARARYELKERLIRDAFLRAQWRCGNETARPHRAEIRSRREIDEALLEAGVEPSQIVRSLVDQLEDTMAELVCHLSPPAGSDR